MVNNQLVENLAKEVIISAKDLNYSEENINKIKSAIDFAYKYHQSQLRKSGEPYVIHPLAVAKILLSWSLDADAICAGILHDTVEDTSATLEDVERIFGETVAKLVDAVTKVSIYSEQNRAANRSKTEIHALNNDNKSNKNEQENTLSVIKVFLGMSRDIRVILIKIADRLHNMRTIKYLKPEKQIRIAQETKDIYANIANRLGMYQVKIEFDNLCMKILEPDEYKKVKLYIQKKTKKYEDIFNESLDKVKTCLNNNHLEAKVISRIKSIASTSEKIKNNENINDLFALRIIVDKLLDCYLALGIIHCNFFNLQNSFKDFISNPKMNLYQSLHTIIIYQGLYIEVQIRTKDMDRIDNYGIAAHWRYKDKTLGYDPQFDSIPKLLNSEDNINDNSINLIKKIAKQKFINILDKNNMKWKTIPDDLNLIDYAYLFNKTKFDYIKSILVNDQNEDLFYVIKQSDAIEIIYSSQKTINKKWEIYSRDNNVKKHIINELQKKHSNIENSSEQFINNIIKETSSKINKSYILDFIKKNFNINSIKEFLDAMKAINISHAELVTLFETKKNNRKNIIHKIKAESWKWTIAKSLFQTEGVNCFFNNIIITDCCSKVPPLDIIGVIHGNNLEVHNLACKHINKKDKIISLKWDIDKIKKSTRSFKAKIDFMGQFTPETSSLIIATIMRFKGTINSFRLEKNKSKNEFTIYSEIYVKNYSNIEKIANELLNRGFISNWKLY